jgi:2-polyprenyl-3-methyl-5-hydroxy-6-metoxy-1,4-benzoquinol methylase
MPRRVPPVPAVLRLVQAAILGRWAISADDLYREVARIVEAAPGRELLIAGCGDGDMAQWLAVRGGAAVTGVDPDPVSIQRAEQRARALETSPAPHFEQGSLDDLPHDEAVFDAVIGNPALSAAKDPARAVAELGRVVRPMGQLLLIQPTWSAEMSPEARELVVERLGLRPRYLVEWKQMMRDARVVDIQVQDWTEGAPGGRTSGAVEQIPPLTWKDKAQITGRALRRSGITEARGAVERETRLLRELSRERSIGLQLISGVKWPHPMKD